MIAALALDLGVRDRQVISTIYPDDRIYATASEAKRRGLSVFSVPTLKNAREYLHQSADAVALRECQGHIDKSTAVGGDGTISRVGGWAFDAEEVRVPEEVFLVDAGNNVVGVGLTGFPRPDVARIINQKAGFAGFDGYLFGGGKNIRLECLK
jgi:hypothetical protein